MVVLSDNQKSQTRFHLVYTDATPLGDRARLESAMSKVPDEWTKTRIGEILSRCETRFSDINTASLQSIQDVGITGDVVRNTVTKEIDTWTERQRFYLSETNVLARALGVRNYRDPEEAIQGYLVDGSAYVNSIPGPTGAAGAKWYTKAGVPTNGEFSESVGDFCLNTSNGHVYEKTDETTWTDRDNLTGPASMVQIYTFDDTLTSGTALGELRLNNAALASATIAYANETGNGSVDLSGIMDEITVGSLVTLVDVQTPSNYIFFSIDTITDLGTERQFDFTHLASKGSFADGITLGMRLSIKGATGATGATGSISGASILELTQTTTPGAIDAGETWIYSKSDGKVYKFPAGGSEEEIGAGGGGNPLTVFARRKLAEVSLGPATATASFTSIDQTYDRLVIVSENPQASTATSGVLMDFNSDTTNANYDRNYAGGVGASAFQAQDNSRGFIACLPTAASANETAITETFIHHYKDTSKYTFIFSRESVAAASNGRALTNNGQWRNTAAVTTIDLSPATGTFSSGKFILYGEKEVTLLESA